MFAQKRLIPRLTFAVALILLVGCVSQDHPVAPLSADQPDLKALLEAPAMIDWPSAVVRAGYPWPDSPDQVIANVRDAYDDEDVAGYASMVSPGFRFVLQAETIEEYDLPRRPLGANDEIRIAYKMCMGLPSQDGERLTDIEVVRMEPLTLWEPVPASDPNFGALVDAERRRYDVLMTFAREGHDNPYTVEGEVLLVVVPQTVATNHESRIAYRLMGGYDETEREDGTDEILWGSLKVMFH